MKGYADDYDELVDDSEIDGFTLLIVTVLICCAFLFLCMAVGMDIQTMPHSPISLWGIR